MTESILVSEDGLQRKATKQEILEFTKLKEESKITAETLEAKVSNRASALAKLAALGLTEEEIGAL